MAEEKNDLQAEETLSQDAPDASDTLTAASVPDASDTPDTASAPDAEQQSKEEALEEQLKALADAEKAIDSAYSTGKVDRAKITQAAQLDAAEAVAMVGVAMEADEVADEAMRFSVIAEKSGDRVKAKEARRQEREARRKANARHKAATKSAKQAYDAIKFSQPNKMGFMRAVQILFAGHIAFVLVWLMLTSRDAMTYNVTTIMDWIMIILEGVAFWMFINRYKIGRPFVIAMAAFGIVVPGIVDIATGHFNIFALLWNNLFYIFLIIYFSVSKRVKATLVNDFSQHAGDFEKEDLVIDRRGWPFFRNLIMYFILFSILGHWMEMGMCQFIRLGLVQGEYDPSNTMLWRDWLYPFPMEGAAVVVIALVLYPFFLWLKKKFANKKIVAYLISFLAGALLCSIIEFGMGLLVNADLQLWDYRDNFCNIMGQVCLQNTMAFGVVAGIITWWVYPLLERLIARVPRDVMNIVFVVVALFGATVWSLYLINPPGTPRAVEASTHATQEEKQAAADATKRDYEVQLVASNLLRVKQELDILDNSIDSTEKLNKEQLKSDIQKTRDSLQHILKEDLKLQDYPSSYEAFVTQVNSSQSSSSSSSGGSSSSASGSNGSSSSSASGSSGSSSSSSSG